MRAVVLVGGEGTRLRPLTLETPKQMLPVANRPMIEWVLGHLSRHGVDEAVLSLGYRPDAFMQAYPDDECAGVRLHYAVEEVLLDTAGAIRYAATEAGFTDETVVVVNGDVLTDLDITDLVAFHRDRGGEATIALTRVEDPSRYGVVPVDGRGRVVAFIEKPSREDAPSHWINAGTYVLEPSVFARIPGDRRVSIERETFPALVADGRLYARESSAYWIDAGTPATYLACQLDLIDGLRGAGPVADRGDGVELAASASVEHSVLGNRVRVGPSATVVDSVVLDGAVIEEGATVSRSVVGPDAVVGVGAKVGDLAVLGNGYHLAAGSVCLGERLPLTREES